MWFFKLHDLLNYLSRLSDLLPAMLVTIAIAMLIACAVGCACSPSKEEDDLFHKDVC